MKSSPIMTINKDEVILKKNPNNFYDDTIEIINLTESFLIYKIFVNVKGIYSTTPASSYVKPKESINVYIKREITKESIANEVIKVSAYIENQVVDVSLNYFRMQILKTSLIRIN